MSSHQQACHCGPRVVTHQCVSWCLYFMICRIKQKALLIKTQGQYKTPYLTANPRSHEAVAKTTATIWVRSVLRFVLHCSSWLMHIPVLQEPCYSSGSLKDSLFFSDHSQLKVLLIPALLPSLKGNHQFLPAFCPTTPAMTPFLLQRKEKSYIS